MNQRCNHPAGFRRAALVERKSDLGVAPELAACHTAVVESHIVEGHVSASDIDRMLRERPDIAGIAVSGMPVGSPGMGYGDRRDPCNVVAYRADGAMKVFARHGQ